MTETSCPSAPFPESCALTVGRLARPHRATSGPASTGDIDSMIHHVPDEPSIKLEAAAVNTYLSRELNTPLLNELYWHLWMVARRSGHNIDALHVQKTEGRQIIATEDPGLHLTWRRDKLYVKPIPVCLLNYDFWMLYLSPTSAEETLASRTPTTSRNTSLKFDRSVAMGFLRSYAFLVQHRIDFILAKESYLIPEEIEWIEWAIFISNFRNVDDEHVAARYHYGQLRVTRLNWAVRIFRPKAASTKWFYKLPHWSILDYIERATIPLLFVFASITLVLSSMQVVLSVPADGLRFEAQDSLADRDVRRAFWIFSVMMLLMSGLTWTLLLGIPFVVLVWQLSWGFRHRQKRPNTSSTVKV